MNESLQSNKFDWKQYDKVVKSQLHDLLEILVVAAYSEAKERMEYPSPLDVATVVKELYKDRIIDHIIKYTEWDALCDSQHSFGRDSYRKIFTGVIEGGESRRPDFKPIIREFLWNYVTESSICINDEVERICKSEGYCNYQGLSDNDINRLNDNASRARDIRAAAG